MGILSPGQYSDVQITHLYNAFGLSDNYSAFSSLAGIVYHF
jgi:hypothetical protein